LAIVEEFVENLAGIGTEPFVLRFERANVEIGCLAPRRPDVLVAELVGIGLRGDVAAGERRAELPVPLFYRLDLDRDFRTVLYLLAPVREIHRSHAIRDGNIEAVHRHVHPAKFLKRRLVGIRPLAVLGRGLLADAVVECDAVAQNFLGLAVVLPPDRETGEIVARADTSL